MAISHCETSAAGDVCAPRDVERRHARKETLERRESDAFEVVPVSGGERNGRVLKSTKGGAMKQVCLLVARRGCAEIFERGPRSALRTSRADSILDKKHSSASFQHGPSPHRLHKHKQTCWRSLALGSLDSRWCRLHSTIRDQLVHPPHSWAPLPMALAASHGPVQRSEAFHVSSRLSRPCQHWRKMSAAWPFAPSV